MKMKKWLLMAYLIPASLLSGSAALLLWAVVVMRYPGNHGFGPHVCQLALYAAAGCALASGFKRLGGWRFAALGAWLFLLATLLTTDVFSMALEHDVWAARHMPDWGEPRWVMPEVMRYWLDRVLGEGDV